MKENEKIEIKNIFKEIKKGNKNEIELLYKKYQKLVYAISFSILKNKENSEDVVQKVFLKIWKMNKEKLPTKNETSWLYSLTKNETLNFIRYRKNEINFDNLYYIGDEDTEIQKIIEQDKFNKLINELNLQEREIVSLKVLSNLSFKEISKMLNIPIGTVQWKYYKAIKTLKIILSNLTIFLVCSSSLITRLLKSMNRISNSLEIIEDKINITVTIVDIGLLCLSIIFLLITIFFTKYQQNLKKKVSK